MQTKVIFYLLAFFYCAPRTIFVYFISQLKAPRLKAPRLKAPQIRGC